MERQKKPNYPHQAPQHKHRGPRHSGGNFIYDVYSSGSRRLNRISNIELFLLSVFAGGFMCLATLLSVILISGVTTAGAQYLLSGLGLSLGLLFVVLTNSVLATEANVFVPANFYHASIAQGSLRLFRFWIISWIGNVIGAFIFAYLAYLTQEYSDSFKQILENIVAGKLAHGSSSAYRSTVELILSGMLANWLVALVGFFALSSKNTINQFIIIFLAFVAIVATNFQYFLTNLGYFSLHAFLGQHGSLLDIFFYNLIPVTLGNILGAGLLVAFPLLFLSKKR